MRASTGFAGVDSPHRHTIAAAVTACAAGAILYGPIVVGLVRQWLQDTGAAYGLVVAAAALVALRQRWERVVTLPVRSSAWGAAALSCAAGCYVVGTLAADVYVQRVSLVAFAAASTWFVCGAPHLRAIAAPLVLCLAAIPPPAALVTDLTLPLQLAASRTAAVSLGALGYEVARDGNVLTLSHITLEVADACSGMRSLFTLLALVAVYGATGGPRPRRVLVLAAAAVPIAIAGNSLRVVATAVLAGRMGEDATRGLAHEATGFLAFTLMCAGLIAFHRAAARAARVQVRT